MREIRLAIAGVGNCASALVAGTYYYDDDDDVSGVMTKSFGGYYVSDITPVCAFDVDERKVGKDLSTAIAANDCDQFESIPDEIDCPVFRGPLLDGAAEHMRNSGETDSFEVDSSRESVDVAEKLREYDVDILINYLPVGSQEAVETYAEACLDADTALVNSMPIFLASDPEWESRFEAQNLPIVGDDIKSQAGATIVHRSLVNMLDNRGIDIESTYQLNVGGNTDFKNMLDNERLTTKKKSKTEAVNSLISEPLDDDDIHIGPSDYIPWLDDKKTAFIRIEGEMFGGADVELDLKLNVVDSPNSAGSAVDAIRAAKVGLDAGKAGAMNAISAYTMKRPPEQIPDSEARSRVKEFLEEALKF